MQVVCKSDGFFQRTSAEGEDSSGAASQGERPKPQEMQNFRFGLLLVLQCGQMMALRFLGPGMEELSGFIIAVAPYFDTKILRPVVDSFFTYWSGSICSRKFKTFWLSSFFSARS
mgnify:CR=1 FL=1